VVFDDRQESVVESKYRNPLGDVGGGFLLYALVGLPMAAAVTVGTIAMTVDVWAHHLRGDVPEWMMSRAGATAMAVAVCVGAGLFSRAMWLAWHSMRGRERGPLVTRRVGWIMTIGWGVPLLVAVLPELSWDAVAAHPWWSALLALVFVALVRAPAVGRSLER
jgi:uncharacterized membrane protein YbhN (UPF0104 family)